jgi:hypothetical protein
MNSLLVRTTVLVTAILVSAPAKAQSRSSDVSESGNRFLEVCSVDEKPMTQWNEMDFLNGGLCEGFMMGLRWHRNVHCTPSTRLSFAGLSERFHRGLRDMPS